MNAKQFLEFKGILLQNTTLITYLEGALRQPDLLELLEEYSRIKIKEMDYKACEGLFPD